MKSPIVDIFDAAVLEIQRALNDQYNAEYSKINAEVSETDSEKAIQDELESKKKDRLLIVEKYQKEKDELYRKYEEKKWKLDNEIYSLEIKQDELDPYMTSDESSELSNLGIAPRGKKSYYSTMMIIKDLPSYLNMKEFPKIVGRFRNMFNLAVSQKEHRDILLKFYSIDWKGIGIDVPPELDIGNIEIKWGVITSDTTKLLN